MRGREQDYVREIGGGGGSGGGNRKSARNFSLFGSRSGSRRYAGMLALVVNGLSSMASVDLSSVDLSSVDVHSVFTSL